MRIRLCASNAAILFAALVNTVNILEGAFCAILGDRKVYHALEKEISAASQQYDGKLSEVPNKNLPLLSASVREYQRLQPTFTVSRGVAKQHYTLPNGMVAPKNSVLTLVPPIFHRDSKTFTDPMSFNPYRMMEQEFADAERQKLYMPFGSGKHRCSGVAMVTNEVKVALGHLIRLFDWELAESLPKQKYFSDRAVSGFVSAPQLRYTRRQIPLGARGIAVSGDTLP